MILEKKNFNICQLHLLLVLFLLVLQNALWKKMDNIRVDLEVVPNAYSETTMKALTFGDDEYYFRLKALKVQNMGDGFGRFTSLRKYDYKKLYDWINNLDKLDSKSNYLASLSAYYFSQNRNVTNMGYVVDFLVQHARRDLTEKWWWLYQSIFLSQRILKDEKLTAELINELISLPKDVVPLWIKQVVTVNFAASGEDCEALRMLFSVEKEYGDLNNEKDLEVKKRKQKELDYIQYFIRETMKKLKKSKVDLVKCLKEE
jgi:hypothetical protein